MGEETGFEVVIVVPKRKRNGSGDEKENGDCVEFLIRELETAGLIVERFRGLPAEFLKVIIFVASETSFLLSCLVSKE